MVLKSRNQVFPVAWCLDRKTFQKQRWATLRASLLPPALVLGKQLASQRLHASPRGEALFRRARPSGVPRGPATSTGSLASQRHAGAEMPAAFPRLEQEGAEKHVVWPIFVSGASFCPDTRLQERSPDPSSKATLWVKAQHEGALPPPCIVLKDPRVPHTARRGA